jgi:Zn-dependent protease
MIFIPLLLSLTIHEYAHAWSAYKLGDDTASRMGRMTLNPIAHIDPIGTVVLPLLGIPFGWAKPVPINPARFTRKIRMGAGMAITAAAGPIANVILAVLAALGFAALVRFGLDDDSLHAAGELLGLTIRLNVSLALFNLIPIPPLDGSRIVDGFMPIRLRPQWDAFTRLSPLLLLALIFFGGQIIAGPSDYFFGLLDRLIRAIV